VLVRKLELPPYTAVIWCVPLFRFEIARLARPAFREPVPTLLVPSLKVTVPVGVAVPGALAATVAVKVTAWLCAEGLREEVTVVVVASLLTVWVRTGEVLVLKLALPL
jgi:hypothetical protein